MSHPWTCHFGDIMTWFVETLTLEFRFRQAISTHPMSTDSFIRGTGGSFFLGGFPVTQQLSANPFNFGELSTTYQGYANRDIRVLKTVWNIERMGDEETAAITNGKRAKNSVCLTPSGSPWQHHTESLRIAAWDNDPWIKQNQTFSVSDWFQGWLSNCQVQGVLMFFPNPTLYPKSRAAKNVPASGLPLPSDLPLSAQAMGCCQKLFFAITCNNNRYQ